MVCKGEIALKPDHDATDNGKMCDAERELEPPGNVAAGGNLSFVVFSLTHAGCGDEGVIELRLDEHLLLAWCPSCAALETFGSSG